MVEYLTNTAGATLLCFLLMGAFGCILTASFRKCYYEILLTFLVTIILIYSFSKLSEGPSLALTSFASGYLLVGVLAARRYFSAKIEINGNRANFLLWSNFPLYFSKYYDHILLDRHRR